MRIIVVHMGDILACPPALNLLNLLEELNIEVVLITTKTKFLPKSKLNNVMFEELCIDYKQIKTPMSKLLYIPKIKKMIWEKIEHYYINDAFIWITSDVALKYLGKKIIGTRYVLQLMELSEELYYYNKLPIFKLNAKKIGNGALAVVVPEYNRAHITKAWWELKNLPLIFPNKPYLKEKIEKNAYVQDKEAKEILKKIGNRKIILYQGILTKERPLDKFIKAIDQLGDKYAFVVMSSGENIYEKIESKNYYFIPFVKPPMHLEITSHAYIGVLSYIPVKSHYSILNAIYCAPNKIYEYSMFGIPMLGNDIPGLRYAFDTSGAGICIYNFDENLIIQGIKSIENNYEKYTYNSKKFYESLDLRTQLTDILENLGNQMKLLEDK